MHILLSQCIYSRMLRQSEAENRANEEKSRAIEIFPELRETLEVIFDALYRADSKELEAWNALLLQETKDLHDCIARYLLFSGFIEAQPKQCQNMT